jgi:hypothetical protein
MHSQLNLIVAQAHQYDLQRAAEGWNAAAPRPSRRFIRRLRLNAIRPAHRVQRPVTAARLATR